MLIVRAIRPLLRQRKSTIHVRTKIGDVRWTKPATTLTPTTPATLKLTKCLLRAGAPWRNTALPIRTGGADSHKSAASQPRAAIAAQSTFQLHRRKRILAPPAIVGTTPASFRPKSGNIEDKDSPYWLENEPQATRKDKFFNLLLPKFKVDAASLKYPKWSWKSKKAPAATTAGEKAVADDNDDDTVICDDSMATMHLYQSADLVQELRRNKQKDSLQNEVGKISASQEEALITEYLKYQRDLASRLGEFWGTEEQQQPQQQRQQQHQQQQPAADVKLTAPYNSLNRILDSYSATINSLSNVHKHLQKYEKFIPQKLMDKIPGFMPQAANASILEGNSQDPDVVKVKNVQGLRMLLKDLEEEESKIDKEQIKARQERYREEAFRNLFACQFSPFRVDAGGRSGRAVDAVADATAAVNVVDVDASPAPTKKRWHIPGWDPAHSVANESLFPGYDAIIPGRNVCTDGAETPKKEAEESRLTKPELEAAFVRLVENVKKNSLNAHEYNKSLYDLNLYLKRNSKLRSLLYEQNLVHLIAKDVVEKRGNAAGLTASLSRETLTLAGHVSPLPKRGVRILAIDGGGVRAVMTALILKRLQEECGVSLNEMFDYVIGVSTGSILTVMSIVYRVPLDDCLRMYKLFSLEVFKRNIILGATRLVWSQSFYDSDYWSALLREDFGDLHLSETARCSSIPKMAILSTATNLPTLTPFVFRNYNLPPNTPSQYPGSCNARVWEAVRASSAAPGYFEEYKLRDIVHQDGGLIMNNPAALAIHEARLLWPREEIQCLVSLGTGRYYPHKRENYADSGLKSKINKLIASATDVEAVHIVLQDLLPKGRYFRFNPYMTEDILLDENRPEKIDQLIEDVELYLRKNGEKLSTAAERLKEDRQPWQKLKAYKPRF